MRILLDGTGGDHAPDAVVEGAVIAASQIEHQITIIGYEKEIKEKLEELNFSGSNIDIVNVTQKIENEDAPVKAVRTKKDSSIVKGLNMVKAGEGDMFISAGNTGALMAAGLFILGRIQGIDRPAIASVYPVFGSTPSLLVDAGANAECKPNNLLEFATMGDIYMSKVLGIKSPKVGLVNIGAEEVKGNTLTKATYGLLKKSHLNFVGNVEAREIPNKACDVIVCDGFVGNVILKTTEGLGLRFGDLLKEKFTEGTRAKIGSLMLMNKLKELKLEFDYSEYGGAPILGVKGPLIKMHGSSNSNAVKNAILKAIPFVEGNVVETIESAVFEIEEIVIEASQA